jgi:hypothetical protein
LQDEWEGTKYLYTKSSTQTNRAELPAKIKERFQTKLITCVEYPEIGDGLERDLFQRVQMGMPLSAAEKLQAVSSPWANFITALEGQFVADENTLGEHLTWDTNRGRDYQGVAYMVYCCDCYPTEECPTALKVMKWSEQLERLPNDQFQTMMRETMKTYLLLASDLQYKWAFSGKKISPVEFTFIGVLLFRLQTEHPELEEDHQLKAGAILTLRTRIRERFDDVRINNRVVKVLWEIINSIVKSPHKEVRKTPTSPLKKTSTSPAIAPRAKKGTARKRKYGEDSDDEYRPTLKKGGATSKSGKW